MIENSQRTDDAPARGSLVAPLIALAAGAITALVVGIFGKVHDPSLRGTTTLGFDTVIDMKVAVTIVIAILALIQVVGALWIYGAFGRSAPPWAGKAHRASGAVALILIVFVAYHCLWALGLETGTLDDGEEVSTRTVVHGVLGCIVIGAIVVKLVAVRARRAPGWFLPLAGGLLFAVLVLAVLTSAVWYIGDEGWPS